MSDNQMFLVALVCAVACGVVWFRRASTLNKRRPLLAGMVGFAAWIAAVAGQTTFLDHYWQPRWWHRLIVKLDDSGAFLVFFAESLVLVVLLAFLAMEAGEQVERETLTRTELRERRRARRTRPNQ